LKKFHDHIQQNIISVIKEISKFSAALAEMYPRMALELGSAEPTLGTAGRRGDEVSRCEDVWPIADKAAFLSTQPLDSRTCVMLTLRSLSVHWMGMRCISEWSNGGCEEKHFYTFGGIQGHFPVRSKTLY